MYCGKPVFHSEVKWIFFRFEFLVGRQHTFSMAFTMVVYMVGSSEKFIGNQFILWGLSYVQISNVLLFSQYHALNLDVLVRTINLNQIFTINFAKKQIF